MKREELFNVEQIAQVRSELNACTVAITVMADKGTSILKAITNGFLSSDDNDAYLVKSLNSLQGKLLERTAIAKLSYKMPFYGIHGFNEFKMEEANLILSKTILNALADLGVIFSYEKVERRLVNGKFKYYQVTHYNFGEEDIKSLTEGVDSEPGKIISRSVKIKPGGAKVKLNAEMKDFAKALSSIEFELVDVSDVLLSRYYKQTKWYKSALAEGSEDKLLLNERVDMYISTIRGLIEGGTQHLSIWFDSRLRTYYELTMLGINPHGDTFETAMWQLANGRELTVDGYESSVHAAVTLGTGVRHNLEKSLKLWSKDEEQIRADLVDESKHGFGELFYNTRLLRSIDTYGTGKTTKFILGKDATTGGLQHFSCGFHSVKAGRGCNVAGYKTIGDAHQAGADAFGVEDRKLYKDTVNTPLLHGSTSRTISLELTKITDSIYSESDVMSHASEAYGDEITNIESIADWGVVAYDNHNSTLLFTALDGWKCQSTSYIKSVPVDVFSISLKAKKGYSKTVVHRNMPLVISAKGEMIYDQSKVRGLYANITHTVDGWMLRHVVRALIGLNKEVLLKHDKFFTHANDMKFVNKVYLDGLVIEYKADAYVRAMNQIKENHKGSNGRLILPEMKYGKLTEKQVASSSNYLMA